MTDLRTALSLSEAMLKKLAKLSIHTLDDCILHLPLRYEDETRITPVADIRVGATVQVAGIINHAQVTMRPRKQLIVRLQDASGYMIHLRFLHFYPSQQKQLAQGESIRAIGVVRMGYFGLEMVHPQIKAMHDSLPEAFTPIYPTVAGLTQPTLRRVIMRALAVADTRDTLPPSLLTQLGLPDFATALHYLHQPTPDCSITELNDRHSIFYQRLIFDELLAQQLSMLEARRLRQQDKITALPLSDHLATALCQHLPFALTTAQQRALTEINNDMAKNHPMCRLLQGDVGSGKTIVAALAALYAIGAGFQVALMAPTEVLAQQHFQKFSTWFDAIDVPLVYLSGSLKKKEKDAARAALANQDAMLAIGTHALFQEDVTFANLGLVMIDEQHRFGVDQRMALKNKGHNVHQLMMSATPIPRSLAMSFFADLDVSIIDELPPGRRPIVTKLIRQSRRHEVQNYVRKTVAKGQQAYWVCPLIEESETLQLQTATETYQELRQNLSDLNVALVHGRLKPAEKNQIMAAFLAGDIQILVATTVIEVGVDVPRASVMVIDHAERMGLSQLHQLRGRVGRGQVGGTCVLLYEEPLNEIAKQRLKVIYENTDGFVIAREDLKLRGPGELLGARQSGVPMLRFADLERDIKWLEQARHFAPWLANHDAEAAKRHLTRWLSDQAMYLSV